MADFRLLARAHGFMKLTEIIIAIVCLILLRKYELNFGGDPIKFADRYNVGLLAIGGMLLVSLPLLVSYLWSSVGAYQPFLEFMYNLLGFVLFMAAGGLALDHYTNQTFYNEAGIALGALCIINGFFYMADTVMALQRGSSL